MEVQAKSDYQESTSTTTTFEWTLRDVKNLFEATKGESKSKATASIKFGGDRWRLLFYPNAGGEGEFSGLYLQCEPTLEEQQGAVDSKWVREGEYKYSLELKRVGRNVTFHQMEAQNRSFSHQSVNWGWAQFIRRDSILLSGNVEQQDAFVISCTIKSSPRSPIPPLEPVRLVPISLLNSVGSLLDDPVYSDVCFIIRRPDQVLRNSKKILAAYAVLRRVPYFEGMFSSGFSEGTSDRLTVDAENNVQDVPSGTSDQSSYFEDSDDDDDGNFEDETQDDEPSGAPLPASETLISSAILTEDETLSVPEGNGPQISIFSQPTSPKRTAEPPSSPHVSERRKMTVVVNDVAYTTYRAVLYYVAGNSVIKTTQDAHLRARKAWIRNWEKSNPDLPLPVSAKAVYRLADKLDLIDLRARALQHILKSLTVENITYEVFSPLAAAFEEIRKVHVSFFLEHWTDIRSSDAMRNFWTQIRNGRHTGFEEVWPVIAQSLELKPPA